jgi:hypothetical protein
MKLFQTLSVSPISDYAEFTADPHHDYVSPAIPMPRARAANPNAVRQLLGIQTEVIGSATPVHITLTNRQSVARAAADQGEGTSSTQLSRSPPVKHPIQPPPLDPPPIVLSKPQHCSQGLRDALCCSSHWCRLTTQNTLQTYTVQRMVVGQGLIPAHHCCLSNFGLYAAVQMDHVTTSQALIMRSGDVLAARR